MAKIGVSPERPTSGRMGSPEELGAACAFVRSDKAHAITGQTLVRGGGTDPGLFWPTADRASSGRGKGFGPYSEAQPANLWPKGSTLSTCPHGCDARFCALDLVGIPVQHHHLKRSLRRADGHSRYLNHVTGAVAFFQASVDRQPEKQHNPPTIAKLTRGRGHARQTCSNVGSAPKA